MYKYAHTHTYLLLPGPDLGGGHPLLPARHHSPTHDDAGGWHRERERERKRACLRVSISSLSFPSPSFLPNLIPFLRGFWGFSGPRWALEAYNINAISYYRYVPSDCVRFAGAPYMDVQTPLRAVGYDVGNIAKGLGLCIAAAAFFQVLSALLMMLLNRSKK